MSLNHRRLGALSLPLWAAGLLFLSGCGGGSNNGNQPSPSATRAAAPNATSAPGAASSTRVAAAPSISPAPACGNDPAYIAAVTKLNPLLIGAAELPPSLKDLDQVTPTGIALCNAVYAQGVQGVTGLKAKLDQAGREGGVRLSWGKSPQYTPGLKTVFSVIDDIAQYTTASGAKEGLTLLFSAVGTGTPQAGSSPVKSSQLAGLSPAGDEIVGYRIDQTFTAVVGNSGSVQAVQQVGYVVAWRRGTALATITVTAVNQDPSLDDINRIVAAQDAKLKSGGY